MTIFRFRNKPLLLFFVIFLVLFNIQLVYGDASVQESAPDTESTSDESSEEEDTPPSVLLQDYAVVVTFDMDETYVDPEEQDEIRAVEGQGFYAEHPDKCKQYTNNVGRAVDAALVTVQVLGEKQSRAWQTFARMNGHLTKLENKLDDLTEKYNDVTQEEEGKNRRLQYWDPMTCQILCDSGATAYCWCIYWGRRRNRNLRGQQRQLAFMSDEELEDLEIEAEKEVANQLGEWNKEIECIKRKWDMPNNRWDYEEAVNVEIIPPTEEGVSVESRTLHRRHKQKRKEEIIVDMRQKIIETKKAIKDLKRKLKDAVKKEQEAEKKAKKARVKIDDIQEDITTLSECTQAA